jgi:hypothetical protein
LRRATTAVLRSRRAGLLFLPAAPESAIEVHDADEFIAADLRQPQLGVEQVAIGIERAKERVDPTVVALVGKIRAVLEGHDESLLL